jgi:hypothetical protein
MSQFPPPLPGPTLNYQSPWARPPGSRRPGLQFLAGLGIGTLFSLVAWSLGFGLAAPSAGSDVLLIAMMWLVPTAKLAAGITFLCLRPYRLLGGGILTSMALGFLIFFGLCTGTVKF